MTENRWARQAEEERKRAAAATDASWAHYHTTLAEYYERLARESHGTQD